jgi:hypothetical protein
VFGVLADNLSPWILTVSTLFCTSFATIVFWGVLGYTFPGIMAFSLVYGSLAGGLPNLWTGFTIELASECAVTAESKNQSFHFGQRRILDYRQHSLDI